MPQRTVTTELPIELHQFASDVSRLVYPARLEYLNRLLNGEKDSLIIKEIQPKYGINKRVANAIRSEVKGAISSATECRAHHIKNIKERIKSLKNWIKENQKKLKKLPKACDIRSKRNVRVNRRFAIHQKKRQLHLLAQKVEHLKNKEITVTLGAKNSQYYTVGSKRETLGNQIAQYDGKNIVFRVPYALEKKYGKYIHASLRFEYEKGQKWLEDAIENNRALTYRIYAKDLRWFIACSTDVPKATRISYPRQYGCLGVDINPGILGWTYCDPDGNLKAQGQIKLNLHSKRKNQQLAILHDATKKIVDLAQKYKCPIVIEKLDFSTKKAQMKEGGRKYSRMLSNFTYGKLIDFLTQKSEDTGIELILVNPAYSSLMGLVKYMRRYGLSDHTAAALVLARRAMSNSERVPLHNAYPLLTGGKHVWTAWSALNKKLNKKLCLPRHSYFSLSNGQLEVKLRDEFLALSSKLKKGSRSKRQRRTSKSGSMPQASILTARNATAQICVDFN
ncbi:MAG: IS200/IS605 family accessory protein TnpB-related protein [Prochloraceae cyanobacterium]|nr:IS200/IS605 family accessory protein TnpB-related protein [Prochloraceae cyanobacterium]